MIAYEQSFFILLNKGEIIMNNLFMVVVVHHNKETKGSSYKIDLASEKLETAEKRYHARLSEYYDSPTFDFFSCMIIDSFGNVIECKSWKETVEPEPQPEDDRLLSEA